jgi:hypothetical protein
MRRGQTVAMDVAGMLLYIHFARDEMFRKSPLGRGAGVGDNQS